MSLNEDKDLLVVLCDTWNWSDDNDTVSGIAILDTTAIPEICYVISMFFRNCQSHTLVITEKCLWTSVCTLTRHSLLCLHEPNILNRNYYICMNHEVRACVSKHCVICQKRKVPGTMAKSLEKVLLSSKKVLVIKDHVTSPYCRTFSPWKFSRTCKHGWYNYDYDARESRWRIQGTLCQRVRQKEFADLHELFEKFEKIVCNPATSAPVERVLQHKWFVQPHCDVFAWTRSW